MALSKAVATGFGVAAGYWRIASVTESYPQRIDVIMGGYVSAEARLAGAQPIARKDYQFLTGVEGEPAPDLVYGADDDRAALYAKIKTLPEWAGSEDA